MHCCVRNSATGLVLASLVRRKVCDAKLPMLRHCSQGSASTHFGFETVKEDEKKERVREVFSSVAKKYDLMNDAMSLGSHRLWKDALVARLAPSARTRLLDVAGGTGDVAFRALRHAEYVSGEAAAPASTADLQVEAERLGVAPILLDDDDASDTDSPQVVVCDINQEMLEEGRRRARQAGLESRLSWVQGDAEKLPFEDDSFDAYTIAFGIRNVTHIEKALAEAHRVLRPGGRFLCLEFSHVENPAVRWLYDQYSFQVIPPMGTVLAGDWKSYQYLVESIRRFPNQLEFEDMVRAAGFGVVTHENLTFGVVAIHSGFKLPESSEGARR